MGAPIGNHNASGNRGGARKRLHSFGVNKATRKVLSNIAKSNEGKWKMGAIHHISSTSPVHKHKTVAGYVKRRYLK